VNRCTSEGSKISVDEYSTRRIRFLSDYFSSDIIWKGILKKAKNEFYKNSQSRFRFSSLRAFQRGSRIFWSPCGFFGDQFFVCVYWGSVQSSSKIKNRWNELLLKKVVTLGKVHYVRVSILGGSSFRAVQGNYRIQYWGRTYTTFEPYRIVSVWMAQTRFDILIPPCDALFYAIPYWTGVFFNPFLSAA